MIDTTRGYIEEGYSREVVPWLLSAWHITAKAIENDAPSDMQRRFLPQYHRFLEAIGLAGLEEIRAKADIIENLATRVLQFSLTLIDSNRDPQP